MIDGYEQDNNSMAQMEALGLPTGFSIRVDPHGKQKKGDKKTFYCQICFIELNSLDTMKSHVKGVKHMKKQLSIREEKEQLYQRGEITMAEMEDLPQVIPIPNPE